MDKKDRAFIKKHIDFIVKPIIKNVICSYSDMLGFGSCLNNLGWDLTKKEENYKSIKRLSFFVERAQKIGGLNSTCFALNDCLAINYDLPEHEPVFLPGVWGFIMYLARNHLLLNETDQKIGFPGVRTVWTGGQRLFDPQWVEGISTEPSGIDVSTVKGVYWVAQTPEGPPGLKKKLARVATYTPREFQLNIAFSKAYKLEGKGSSIGLQGPGLYVDESFLEVLVKTLDGNSRTRADCWEYYINVETGENTKIIKLCHPSYTNNGKQSPQIKLKEIASNLKMPWGGTSVYKMMEIQGIEGFGEVEKIRF